ncbi:hypothetical protein Nepgr_033619 [Nepenthes gracilis]|uniref:Uncharacterized protein n=1 Tax=Nepenthes gracilis TaxID=150966 RepID=A0AAD3TKS3_NEPGR|nr:hypothetical protein Nepgr_033619 [Nepenthes gracilis]
MVLISAHEAYGCGWGICRCGFGCCVGDVSDAEQILQVAFAPVLGIGAGNADILLSLLFNRHLGVDAGCLDSFRPSEASRLELLISPLMLFHGRRVPVSMLLDLPCSLFLFMLPANFLRRGCGWSCPLAAAMTLRGWLTVLMMDRGLIILLYMLGAPSFGGDLIGCECIPGLSFTLAAGGGHALRASVPAGFAATDLNAHHLVLWMTISQYDGGCTAEAVVILLTAEMCRVAGPELMASCCDGLSIAFRCGFSRLELVVFLNRLLHCFVAGVMGMVPWLSVPALLYTCSSLCEPMAEWIFSVIGSAIIIAIVADARDDGVLPTMLMVEKPIEKVLSSVPLIHVKKMALSLGSEIFGV